MTAELILQQIPSEYSNLQIEASLIRTFLSREGLEGYTLTSALKEVLAYSSNTLCVLLEEIVGESLTLKLMENVFEVLVDEKEKRENGVVFTPCYIVDFIIRNTMSSGLEIDSRVIDPACGSGAFLLQAAEYISKQLSRPIADVISKNIFGIDISADNVRRTKELLMLLALSHGEAIDSLQLNIEIADSLQVDWNSIFGITTFEFIIGNPPYVNTHDMSKTTISYLKSAFETTQKGTFNIFYAFIEQSMKYLSNDGELGFIVPNNYLTITAAENLRKYLAENKYISKIIDFGENMVFAPVRTYNSLLFLSKHYNQMFEYATMERTNDIERTLESIVLLPMPIADLDSAGWKLLTETEKKNIKRIECAGKPIKSYVRVGIATLRDNVYLLDGFDAERGLYYKTFDGERFFIEPEITREIYKISNIKAESSLLEAKQHIIFPYEETEQLLLQDMASRIYQILPENTLSSRYPHCYQYLCRCRAILDERDKGRGNAVAWYAYGRSQGLGKNSRKLLFPTFSLHPKFMLESDPDTLFCNGYAIMESDEYALEILQKILNSAVMEYYISKTSYSIEGNYKCYQKKYIQHFSIPSFSDKEIQFLAEEDDQTVVDAFLISKYQLQL